MKLDPKEIALLNQFQGKVENNRDELTSAELEQVRGGGVIIPQKPSKQGNSSVKTLSDPEQARSIIAV